VTTPTTSRGRNLAIGVTSCLLALATLSACSDDGVASIDASCSCPAGEPPLAGRIVRVRGTGDLEANVGGLAGISCPTGATLLGGSCRLMTPARGVYLMEAGAADGAVGYLCWWDSTSNEPNVGIAEAICLLPPP
jgi:hypothetical protein